MKTPKLDHFHKENAPSNNEIKNNIHNCYKLQSFNCDSN